MGRHRDDDRQNTIAVAELIDRLQPQSAEIVRWPEPVDRAWAEEPVHSG